MSANKKNILTGATVIGALIAVGWMLLKFGAAPAKFFAEESIPFTIDADRADGINEGSLIYYRGVGVGRVLDVKLAEGNKGVRMLASVDRSLDIPANVTGVIRFGNFLGGSAQLTLELIDPEPVGKLDKSTRIRARYIGLDILPREFTGLAEDLRLTAKQFRESRLLDNLNNTITSAQKTIESVHELVQDKNLRGKIDQSVENVRVATETATRIASKLEVFSDDLHKLAGEASTTITKTQQTVEKTQTHVDAIAVQMVDRIGQLGKLMQTFQSISAKIDEGKGTAGQLVNDPKLYESLVDTSKELKSTISDMKRLVEQWEQEGISFKLGK